MERLIKILIPLLTLVVLYFIAAFIAWDFNPMHWWLVTNIWGRVIFVVWIGAFIKEALNFYFN